MFIVNVTKNSIAVEGKELITSGSVKTNFVQFDFDDEWTGLTKTVIFQTKKVSIPIILEEGVRYQLPIPWEVMAYPNETINVGVYGVRKDDEETTDVDEEIVLPTIWGTIGKVTQGVLVPNPPTTPPTADSYLQLLAYIDRLIGSGGGGGPSIPGIDGVSPIITTEELPDGAGVRVIVTDVEGEKSFDIFNGLNGQDGKDGEPGTPGKDGVNGKDGESGATFIPTVSEEGVISWENDKGLPNPPSVNIKGPPGENGTGGMPEALDKYSTEETRIGTWTNGKPIYRVVIQTTTGVNGRENVLYTFSYTVETLVNLYGSICQADAGDIPINGPTTIDGDFSMFYLSIDKTKLMEQHPLSSRSNLSVNIVVEYTKKSNFGSGVWWSPKMTGANNPSLYNATASRQDISALYHYGYAWQAFDEDKQTGWYDRASGANAWLQFESSDPISIKGIRARPTSDMNDACMPLKIRVMSVDDAGNETEIGLLNPPFDSNSSSVPHDWVTLEFDSTITSKRFKFRCGGSGYDSSYNIIGEIQFLRTDT